MTKSTIARGTTRRGTTGTLGPQRLNTDPGIVPVTESGIDQAEDLEAEEEMDQEEGLEEDRQEDVDSAVAVDSDPEEERLDAEAECNYARKPDRGLTMVAEEDTIVDTRDVLKEKVDSDIGAQAMMGDLTRVYLEEDKMVTT